LTPHTSVALIKEYEQRFKKRAVLNEK